MKKIFVVDYKEKIHSVLVRKNDWTKRVCVGWIKGQAIIVQRGGWTKLTTYSGFETRRMAEKFRDEEKKQR